MGRAQRQFLIAELFGKGGNVGEFRQALGAGDADHSEIAGEHIGLLVDGHAEAAGDMASQQGGGDVVAACIGHMRQGHVRELLQQQGHEQALGGKRAVACIIVFAGIGLGRFNEPLEILDRRIGVDGQTQPHDGDLRYRAEILDVVARGLDLGRG